MSNTNEKLDLLIKMIDDNKKIMLDLDTRLKVIENKVNDVHEHVPFVNSLKKKLNYLNFFYPSSTKEILTIE
jgi:hypothetical protein